MAIALLAPCAVRRCADRHVDDELRRERLKVILRRNPSNDVVAANVYLLGGTQQLTPATQGIESFLLNASERGTQRFPARRGARDGLAARQHGRRRAERRLDAVRLHEHSRRRSTRRGRCSPIASWRRLSTRREVELMRARMLTGAREESNNPDPLINRLADSLLFVGHPYGFSPDGTESSLFSITLSELKHYQATQMVTSRMLLVVVGNIDRPHVEQLVAGTLGKLPHGNYTWSAPRDAGQARPRVAGSRRTTADQLHPRLLRRSSRSERGLPGASRGHCRPGGTLLHADSLAAQPFIRSRRAVSRSRRRGGRCVRHDGSPERNAHAHARRDRSTSTHG